ncbi:MAG: hypothetical protein CVU09_06510 [Bacteroidetes bacterium HGW-Bacteroidetes-4]|nr:MAG: hypothetical protein CVU09_06510 [Bacteroidetes bacterium HGW-Bacteroidetes-4]
MFILGLVFLKKEKMEKLIVKPSRTNPYICFDPVNKVYEISGNSFPENPQLVFEPIFNWLNSNIQKIEHRIELNLMAIYFNSASNRLLLKLFRFLEEQAQAGKDIEVVWNYMDEEIQNDGILFSRILKLPFRMVPVTSID